MSRLALAAVFALCLPAAADQPKTVAERTNYQETSRHADVLAFCDDLAKQFPTVKRTDFGKSGQDRPLPLLILSDPPVATVEAAAKSDKTRVLVFANIHAGEVDGKEAVLALARDLATAKSDLLKKLVILIVPNLNPDGNEKISPKNRTSQNGPPAVGERANAGGFDLNRDFVKLETPEIRRWSGSWTRPIRCSLSTATRPTAATTGTPSPTTAPGTPAAVTGWCRSARTPSCPRWPRR